MYLTIQGLVLRVTKYNDKDAILTVLSQKHGKLTVKARGLLRKNSPLAAPCQLLAFGEFTLFEYRGFYTINEASSVELFHGLRRDLTRLSLATYFTQVADTLSQEDLPNPELLSLVLNCLYALDKLQLPENQVKAVFELRSACIAGYTPDLSCCYHCGAPHPQRWNVAEGRLECTNCKNYESTGLRLPISSGALDAARYICSCDSSKLFGFKAGEDTLENLANVTEVYLTTQLEQSFSSLDFYKSLYYTIN